MHAARIDLNLFPVLQAIYTEGGITGAARTLNLTQPAVSHALKRLRLLFGDPLFIRQNNRMVPTPLTRSLIGPVRESLGTLATALQQARGFDPANAQRTFRIGLRPVIEARVLEPLMARIAHAAPGVRIASVALARAKLEADLASGALDLAVDIAVEVSRQVRRTGLVPDALVVVARGSDTAPEGVELGLEDYLAREHILVSSRRSGGGLEDEQLARIGRQRRIRLRCQQYDTACRVTSETPLLLTMPSQYARLLAATSPVRLYPFPLAMPPPDVFLYWHQHYHADPASRWLRELLAEIFRGGPAPENPDA